MTPEATASLDATDLTATQRERRERMLAAAVELARAGGFDGVQMRDVADSADVALGTLYRYFPSKVHLLVSVLQQMVEQLNREVTQAAVPGDTAAERVLHLLTRSMRVLKRQPQLADAMMRALFFADASAAADVERVNELFSAAITHAIGGEDRSPRADDDAVARVIENVWWAYILSWLSGRVTAKQVTDELDVAVRLLVR